MKNPINTFIPQIDRLQLDAAYGGFQAMGPLPSIGNVNYQSLAMPRVGTPGIMPPETGGDNYKSARELESFLTTRKDDGGMLRGGSITRSLNQVQNERYDNFVPGEYDIEDAYAQNQPWTTKAFNGISKGLALTGTTFLQTTVGNVNGLIQWKKDGRFASFYDNEFNRNLDEFSKGLETTLPTYETNKFRDARWYSPDYLLTGNFLWEGVVKNLGFAAGAALSGNVFATGLRGLSQLPKISRMFSAGKIAEGVAASEASITGVSNLGKVKDMSDKFLGAYSALNKGQRLTVAGLATTGEAGIEAMHNLNEVRARVIADFEEDKGRPPNKSELALINEMADNVGNGTFIGNVGLLSLTNYIQFPKILGSSFKAEKGLLNELSSKTGNLAKEGGKYVAEKSTFLGRVGKAVANPYIFSYSEAFEEGGQFAISKATEDYYDKKYKNEDHSWLESINAGIEETINTDEGMKNLVIGGISGALMLAKGKFQESSKKREATSEAIREGKWKDTGLNSAVITDFMNDTYDAIRRGTEIQKEREAYIANGDILNSKDAEADYIINYLAPRIKHGRYDLVMADIQDFQERASTDEGFADLIREGIAQETDTREAFQERLTNFKQTAENVKSLYQSLGLRYRGARDKNGDLLYKDEVIDKMVYAASKISDYDQRYTQLSSEILTAVPNIDEIATAAIEKNDEPLNNALAEIQGQKNITETEKDRLAEMTKDATIIAVKRDQFLKEYNKIKETPEDFSEKTREDIDVEDEDAEEIIVKAGKTEERKVKTNKPYYLLENVRFSRDGIRAIRKPEKVVILKQNPDGSVELEFENGQVKTFTPEELAKYNLGDIETVENNKAAKWVFDNLNNEFVHYGATQEGYTRTGNRKKEEPARGYLEYNHKTESVDFVFRTPKGKMYSRSVSGKDFVRSKFSDYPGALIRRTGKELTTEEQTVLSKSLPISEVIKKRQAVVDDLYKGLLKEITSIRKKIEDNNKKLTQLDEDIANAYLTKTGQPRKRITKKIHDTVARLEKMKEENSSQNEQLKEQQILLENELDTVESVLEEIETTTAPDNKFLEQLENEIRDVKELIGLTKDAIKQTERQLPLIEALYKQALNLLNNFIDRMVSLNPGLPLSVEDYRESMERFIGAEGAEGVISRGEGFTEQILDIENTILSYSEGLVFPKHEARFLKMSENLQELKKALPEYEANLRAQEKIFQAFVENQQERTQQQEVEKAVVENPVAKRQMDSSLDTSEEVQPSEQDFIPMAKKAANIIPVSTTVPVSEREHHIRSNAFGFALPEMKKEGKDVRAVYVTSKTERSIGMSGLMKHLYPDGTQEQQDAIIAVVMVKETEEGDLIPLDVKGNPLEEGFVENGIYQTMPLASLTWESGQSMFRDNTPDDVIKGVKTKYKEWRQEILDRDTIDSTFEPSASFGKLEFKEEQKTSVVMAGFVDNNNQLTSNQVINISTTQEVVTLGTTTYPNPYKRVLLKTPNGFVQLQNKQHSNEQATNIYRAIHALAHELAHGEEKLKSDKSTRLLDYLKGIVYWGLPTDRKNNLKETGYSSIYFTTEPGSEYPSLIVGKNNDPFVFTPTNLEANSGAIISAIETLYTNTNYSKIKDMSEPYEEVLSFKEEGETFDIGEARIWPNYQSYLLSDTLPTDEGTTLSTSKKRTNIPLTTVANPITESEPVNRKTIYFYNLSLEEHFTVKAREKINLKTAQQQTSENVSAEEVISLLSENPEYAEKLNKIENKEEKERTAKLLFLSLALREIALAREEIASIADPKERNKAVDAFAEKFRSEIAKSKKDKTLVLNQAVNSLWEAWHSIQAEKEAQKTRRQKKQEGSLSMTAEEASAFSFAEGPSEGLSMTAEEAGVLSSDEEAVEDIGVQNFPTKEEIEEQTNPTKEPAETPEGENISSKGTDFAKLLTNPGNSLQVSYKGRVFRNAEHAYQSWKSGDFDVVAYNSTAFKPKGSKSVNKATSFQTMVEIITAKLKQYPELLSGINERGGLSYLTNSTHNVTGDLFWESEGENKFMEALTEAYVIATRELTDKKPVSKNRVRKGRNRGYRKVLEDKYKKITTEDWAKAEKWLTRNFPNVPVYRLKNVIHNTNGDAAWGMFENGAIYVYENAEVGTIYHEVFEAVWKMFTPIAEQQSIEEEFKEREGTFVDRPSGKTISYKEATPLQIKEQLAEEFRDFVNKKRLPPKGIKGWILKLFKDLKKFVLSVKRRLTSGKTDKIGELFDLIDTGFYKKYMPYAKELSFAEKGLIESEEEIITDDASFSKIPGLTDLQLNDIVMEMIYSTLNKILQSSAGLFSLSPVRVSDEILLNDLKTTIRFAREETQFALEDDVITKDDAEHELLILFQAEKSIKENFPEIKKLFISRIGMFGVDVDPDGDAQVTDENKTRNSDYVDATKVDKFKKMNPALKLLFHTVAKVDEDGNDMASFIGGVKTMSFSEVSTVLMNTLKDARNIEEMQEKFRVLAEQNKNYRRLYHQFFNVSHLEEGAGFQNVKTIQRFRMISGLWKMFSLFAPKVKNVFILENGDIEVGDASLSTQALQLRDQFTNDIILRSKKGQGLFRYNPKQATYDLDRDKLKKHRLTSKTAYYMFLKDLGIPFSVAEQEKLSAPQYEKFKEVVSGLRMSLNTVYSLKTFSSTTLDMHLRMLQLGLLKSAVSQEAFQSTFFNVAGERTQTYIGGNTPSRLFKVLSQIGNLKELEGTPYDYLIPKKDAFVEGSVVLSKMFDEKGNRIESASMEEPLMTVGYAGGTLNDKKGKKTTSSSLTFRDRLLQEMNLNLKGWYLNLVPGDSSTEWMTFMSNHVSEKSLIRGYDAIRPIFKNYFVSEVEMSREGREVDASRDTTELRFLQGILSPKLIGKIKRSNKPAEELYERYQDEIEKSIEDAIDKNTSALRSTLEKFEAIQEEDNNPGKFTIENVDIKNATEKDIDRKLKMLTVNYMINTIEQHKLIYGDPYLYKDQLKRTKSFQSPRQEILNSSNEINELMDKIWNNKFKDNPYGKIDFIRDYFRTTTYNDVSLVSEFESYGIMEETDGAGIIGLRGVKNFKLRSSDWNEANERQFEYEVAWEEMHKKGLKRIKDGTLTEEQLMKNLDKLVNPKVKSTYTSLKPVVTGNRAKGNGTNQVVVDKYALHILSYRMMVEMNAKNGIALHNKMLNEDIDYVIFNSGRKVGAFHKTNPYTKKGNLNKQPFPKNTIVNIPFSNIGLQTEVPSKDKGTTVRGSQSTKLITMDKMDAGVPLDFMPEESSFMNRFRAWNKLTEEEKEDNSDLYAEINLNKKLLEAKTEHGYKVLLTKLGIEEKPNGELIIKDFEKTAQLLKGQVESREVNDNIIDALERLMTSNSILEASPAYKQISNILYSIVDKNMVHPEMPGGMKVLVPSTFWEENRMASVDVNGKQVYTSDVLKFYTDEATGENVMEIFVSRWFNSRLSDKDLLEYLNTTKAGQKILSGFAYRIPTQNMNSIDAFRIKRFLPQEYGDNVVVPAALVGKTGSDFDIDKLSMYLKNVWEGINGKPTVVSYYGIGEGALEAARSDARKQLKAELNYKEELADKEFSHVKMFSDIALGKPMDPKKKWMWLNRFRQWFENELIAVPDSYDTFLDENGRISLEFRLPIATIENIYMNKLEKLGKRLNELTDKESFDVLVEIEANRLYRAGLENAYIDSNIALLTHAANHEKLTSPNSAKIMEELAEKIHIKNGNEKVEYSNPNNFLDRTFMTYLRHSFVAGKKGIGIAAVGQVNNALNQHQLIIVDKNKIKLAPKEEREFFGDGEVKFKKYNSVYINKEKYPTLSFMKNRDKVAKYISDLLGMFIDGYVDITNGSWIMQMGATPEVTGVWQFLIKIGVPLEDVAFFMNQPIIKDYLQILENKGYRWLFIKDYTEKLKNEKYNSDTELDINAIPSASTLWKTVGKTEFTDIEKAEQRFYLDEFLKYAMMARHLYYTTQGTNYDTATFNNSLLLFKKQKQLERAQSSVISSPDDLQLGSSEGTINNMLNNTFLGSLKTNLEKVKGMMGQILISNKKNVSDVVEKAMLPYINLRDQDFVKMGERVITTLFDWAVHTRTGLGNELTDILIGKDNAARRINTLVNASKNPGHPLYGNYLMESIEIMPSKLAEEGGTDNIRLSSRNSDVYDQNRMIYAFRELKDYLQEDKKLYMDLIKLGILQSGLTPSTISFTSLIPFEDFADFYNETLSLLENQVNLDDFNKVNVLPRSMWNNPDVVGYERAVWIPTTRGKAYNPNMQFWGMQGVKEAIDRKEIPLVMTLSTWKRTNDFIAYTWEQQLELLTEEERKSLEGKPLSDFYSFLNDKKKKMREAGDYSFIHKVLMQKVKTKDGEDYTVTNNSKDYYIYKSINAWGNGNRANEFYETAIPSVINNGFDKVELESSDEKIIDTFDRVLEAGDRRYNPNSGVRNVPSSRKDHKIQLKDGKFYKFSQINSEFLISLGYTDENEIGRIVKKTCL